MSEADHAERAREALGYSRWVPLLSAAAMMAVVSPYQYVWSSIEGPLSQSLSVPLAELGLTFTLFVVFQAGSQFPVGWWRDRHGPRAITAVAGLLAGGGYVGVGAASTVTELYVAYSVGAVGVGIVYTVAVNTALKWFPARRGLTAGVGTMAFAAGGALFVPYVRANATVAGYSEVLRNMGLLIAVVVTGGALLLRDPPAGLFGEAATDGGTDAGSGTDSADGLGPSSADETDEYGPRAMLRTWQFWVMYGMFVGVGAAGLMLTAKVIPFAGAMGVDAAMATAAATLLPLASGVGRVVLGDLADRLDPRRTMALSFTVCGLGVFGVVAAAASGSGPAFVGAVVVATFCWSSQYTLFPVVVTDYYGVADSSGNNALLYTAKIPGGVFGGTVAGALVTLTDWPTAFLVGGTLALLAGVAALFLRPPDA
jgi:OFA family oxalate/formate antiporter-like MFS transporter